MAESGIERDVTLVTRHSAVLGLFEFFTNKIMAIQKDKNFRMICDPTTVDVVLDVQFKRHQIQEF